LLGDPRHGDELDRLSIPESDRAGLVEQQCVHVTGGLDRAARHREHVALYEPVHAGDTDRGQERADRRRDEADQQRHKDDAGDAVRRQGPRVGDAELLSLGEDRKWLQRRDGEQEDDRQRCEQDVESDLVRGLLPGSAFDESDHPVDEALPRLLRDLHHDVIGEHARAAGDGGSVATGLADDRRRLAGDRRLVDARDPFDDVTVARDGLAGFDDDDVALPQLRRRHVFARARCRVAALRPPDQPVGDGVGLGSPQRLRLCLAAAFGDCLGQVRKQHGHPQPDRRDDRERGVVPNRQPRRVDRADLHDEHDRVLVERARVELAEGVRR
jgi:hypothetical protein